ncbi:GNAT family N-acetyltransferase [Streptomyces sp. NPDC015140]|uniref:GNAT family N-acetyltransferase n=1 Tax=Streptomyces sp. NPDC015140 TaxID=3364943 RepID=UPI0036FAD9B7
MTAEPLERSLCRIDQLTGSPRRPGGPPLDLRTARESDLPELRRLDEEVFQDFAYPGFLLRQLFDMYEEHFLVLDDRTGRLCGYVLAATRALGADSWILGLCVAEDRRRHGLGRELMMEVLVRLRRDGIRKVRLTVEPTNLATICLYHDLGFRPEEPAGGLRPDYFGPGMHRQIMRLDLPGLA